MQEDGRARACHDRPLRVVPVGGGRRGWAHGGTHCNRTATCKTRREARCIALAGRRVIQTLLNIFNIRLTNGIY
jgi:hypothetical protein